MGLTPRYQSPISDIIEIFLYALQALLPRDGAGGARPRDPRGGGFDPGDAAAFAAASAPPLPGVPQGQSGFASRGG